MRLGISFKYWVARFLGGTTGENNDQKAKEMILADIKRAREDIKIVTCTAHNSYWSKDVLNILEQQLTKYPSMHVEFLVGPDYKIKENEKLEALAKSQKIQIIQLKERPPFDLRIIDNSDTYVSNHGDNEQRRMYCWTFGNLYALQDRQKHYLKIKKETAA
ncbi:MAG: hypothetical protein V1899_07115 [Planctomycetota bacterium]